MFLKLIAKPGMKRSEVAFFLESEAKVSRSTAERIIGEAADAKYIEISKREDGPGLEIVLAKDIMEFFSRAFRANLVRGKKRDELFGHFLTEINT